MKYLAVILVLAVVCKCSLTEIDYQREFTSWMIKYQKTYTHDTFQFRYRIFRTNLDKINEHNSANKPFTLRMNQFGDLTNTEYRKIYNGLKSNIVPIFPVPALNSTVFLGDIPDSWDWRNKGAVTAIKNQGECGSCWAFSATGCVEGVHYISNQSLVGLSEQNLVDCSTSEGNMGCNGGLMDYAFQYIINNQGIDSESSYPYTATGPNRCKYNSQNNAATIANYKDVQSGSELSLQQAAYKQPVSVGIDASQSSFQFYSGGVYYDPNCSSQMLDHGVLVVGWGTDNGTDYWLVKNSWGTDWGIKGYIMMSRNRQNNCGIATAASYACVDSC